MKSKCYKWAVIILLLINVTIEIVILCIICPRIITSGNLGFDYLGVIVGILAFLVTFLLGYQIWNIINIENKIKREIENAYLKDRERLIEDIKQKGLMYVDILSLDIDGDKDLKEAFRKLISLYKGTN